MSNRVQDLVRAVGKLPPRKRAAVVTLVILVVLTWIAACAALASLFAG